MLVRAGWSAIIGGRSMESAASSRGWTESGGEDGDLVGLVAGSVGNARVMEYDTRGGNRSGLIVLDDGDSSRENVEHVGRARVVMGSYGRPNTQPERLDQQLGFVNEICRNYFAVVGLEIGNAVHATRTPGAPLGLGCSERLASPGHRVASPTK